MRTRQQLLGAALVHQPLVHSRVHFPLWQHRCWKWSHAVWLLGSSDYTMCHYCLLKVGKYRQGLGHKPMGNPHEMTFVSFASPRAGERLRKAPRVTAFTLNLHSVSVMLLCKSAFSRHSMPGLTNTTQCTSLSVHDSLVKLVKILQNQPVSMGCHILKMYSRNAACFAYHKNGPSLIFLYVKCIKNAAEVGTWTFYNKLEDDFCLCRLILH